jgi:heme oxygenase
MGFSKLLREGIWDIHSMADSSTVAQDMQEAKTTFEDMKKITAGLYYIYNTLEDAIEQNKDNPYVSNHRRFEVLLWRELP